MESEDTKTNRRKLGGAARLLALIAVLVNFMGVAALAMTVFPISLNLMISGLLPGDFTSYIVLGLGMAFTPMIKFFPGIMMPLIAQGLLRAGIRRASAGILLVCGAITIPPIIIGGSLILDPLLAIHGILPLVPHVIGGALLVVAGVLALLWMPPPESAPTTFVSVRTQPALTIHTEPAVREVVLVVCPFCGTKNPQGTTKCSNCGGRI